jgi:flagellar basal-body rod protein FlgB
MHIFDKTLNLIERSLDLRAARHEVIAGNIANEETPGYRAKEYHFLDALAAAAQSRPQSQMAVTHQAHLGPHDHSTQAVKGTIETLPSPDLPLDGNSVNLEFEMAKLSDNAMNYNTATQIVAMRLRQLMAAIKN